jgi:nicotinate-nucleotide adenylyltransferase
MRIGLYGGSFDPVHLGHLLVAQAAREEACLDRIIFIPAAQSPFKPGRKLTPDHLRLAMLRHALAGRPWTDIDLQELNRGGVSYTIDTIRQYRQTNPSSQIHYLIGADHVSQLPKWREAAELAQLVHFLVIPRPGSADQSFPSPFHGSFLRGFPLGLSASEIRGRAKARLPIDLLVPPGVPEIIQNNALYL